MSVIAACGGDDDGGGEEAGGGGEGGKPGGSIRSRMPSQPDFLDPASAYTVNAWEPMWLVYMPPLDVQARRGRGGHGGHPGPGGGAADGLRGRKDLRADLRKGLKYSDGYARSRPTTSSTRSSACSIQESGGSGVLPRHRGRRGLTRRPAKPEGDIKGIVADDQTGKVTINLTEPDGTFTNVLAMPTSRAWFPSDTPFKILTEDPPPGVGMYRSRSRCRTGSS